MISTSSPARSGRPTTARTPSPSTNPSTTTAAAVTCTGAYDACLDEDNDGFNNADEIDNGTDPCASGSFPPDADGDLVSDLNDDDDDNDGLLDVVDPFAIDPANGLATSLPVDYTFSINSGDLIPGTFFNLGFTGLMTNGTTDYLDLFDPGKLAAGGRGGILHRRGRARPATLYQGANNQEFAFQFGIDVDTDSPPFMVHTRLQPPFFGGVAPVDYQAFGLQLGIGDQDNYLKVVFTANGGAGGVQVLLEMAGTACRNHLWAGGCRGSARLPEPLTCMPLSIRSGSIDPGPGLDRRRSNLGGSGPAGGHAGAWLAPGDDRGLAVGIIATSAGSGIPFNATWDLIEAKVTSSDAAATLTVTAGRRHQCQHLRQRLLSAYQ